MLVFVVFISIKWTGRLSLFPAILTHVLRSRSPSKEISRSLQRAAIWAHLHAGLWTAWWTCSARLLNGQPDWECINIRARGKEDGLIQGEREREREDRGRDCEINTVSARMTERLWARDGKKIDCLKPKAKKLQCRAQAPWIHTVLPIGWQTAWYTVPYHPLMNSL